MILRADGTIGTTLPVLAEGSPVVHRDEIVAFCDDLLRSADYQDFAVNGLQVEGREQVSRIATAVSTSERTLREAIDWGADALLVHHGLLFGSKMLPLTGLFARRLRLLFQNDINLIGYHLPLDGHEEIGNCALLSEAAGFRQVDRFAWAGGQPLGVVGAPQNPVTVSDLLDRLRQVTEREPELLPDGRDRNVERAGFITGSGYSALEDAIRADCQVLVTGDVREPTMAEARELGIAVIAAGHEATERLGVQALAGRLREHFDVQTRYFHDPNPI